MSNRMLNVPRKLAGEIEQIMACDDAKLLLKGIEDDLGLNVESYCRIAARIVRLEEMGVAVEIDVPIVPYLRKIGYGQMLPQLLVTLQGHVELLDRACALAIPDQQKIVDNQPFKVMELSGDFRTVPPLSMTRREIQQVFCRGRIRDEAEQVGWLRERSLKPMRATNEQSIEFDKKRKGVVIDGVFHSKSELLGWLNNI